MSHEPQDVTVVLRAYADGDQEAFERIIGLVYDDLRRIAHRQLGRARFGQTLNTTGLVHEAYLKMVDQERASWEDRSHFFAITARAMRQIIVDFARKRSAAKRGGGEIPEELDENRVAVLQEAERVIALDEALTNLREIDETMVRVVECRFFSGLTEQETADALNLSLRTVQRQWMRARAWLKEELR